MTARARFFRPLAGFTLVELLVSIVVLTMLTLALFNVLSATTTSWNRTEQRADSYREARAALDLMARDLRTMVKSADFDFLAWKKGGVGNGVSITGYQTPAANGDTAFFYSLQPGTAQDPDPTKRNFGQMCRVGFYVSYTPDGSGRSSYKLYRHLEMSGAVGNVPATFAATANPGDPATDEVLARNVVDFLVTPYWEVGDGTVTTTAPSNTARTMPAMIELQLLAFSDGTAGQFPNAGAWEGTNSAFQRARLAGGQSFTTRVYLRNR